MTKNCEKCGVRQHVFSGADTLKDFMSLITRPRPEFGKIIMLAHNMKAYNGQFVLNYMTTQLKWTTEVFMNGSKIQVIKHSNITILDSLNFFSCKLSDLPGMFQLNCENKGYFPHFFNKQNHWDYVGELPPTSEYGCDTIKIEERLVFLNWHAQQVQENTLFNFKEEIKNYCIQDVNISRKACLSFRKMFLDENGIDPLLNSVTIASACMLTFRKLYLKENTIGIIPNGGYRMRDNQSAVALEWLRWLEHERNIRIQHSGNGREAKIDGYKVTILFHAITFY